MSNIITSYQEEQQIPRPEPQSAKLATVRYVGGDGLSVQFDGETSYDQVQYVCNTGQVFKSGDRVLVQKVGGSYVIVCAIGEPIYSLDANYAVSANSANTAKVADAVENHAPYADIEFACETQGQLWVKCGTTYMRINGTAGIPPFSWR